MNLQLGEALIFLAPPTFSALSLMVMHWFPSGRLYAAPINYVAGTSVTVGVPVLAMLLTALLGEHRSEAYWAALLLVNTAVSGLAVMLAYWIDAQRKAPITLDEVADANGR